MCPYKVTHTRSLSTGSSAYFLPKSFLQTFQGVVFFHPASVAPLRVHTSMKWVHDDFTKLFKVVEANYINALLPTMGRIYIQMLDIWYWYISIWNTGYVDISTNGSGSRIFLLHKISFLATGYRIWIYIHLKSVDLDMILYSKKVDMTHSCANLKFKFEINIEGKKVESFPISAAFIFCHISTTTFKSILSHSWSLLFTT